MALQRLSTKEHGPPRLIFDALEGLEVEGEIFHRTASNGHRGQTMVDSI